MIGLFSYIFDTESAYALQIIDVDADMKVYNLMMKADGIVDDSITKGSDSNE